MPISSSFHRIRLAATFIIILSLSLLSSNYISEVNAARHECPSSKLDPEELKDSIRQFQNKVHDMGIEHVLHADFDNESSSAGSGFKGFRLSQAGAGSTARSPYPITVPVHWHMINEVIPDPNVNLQLNKMNEAFGGYFRFVLANVSTCMGSGRHVFIVTAFKFLTAVTQGETTCFSHPSTFYSSTAFVNGILNTYDCVEKSLEQSPLERYPH
jgi:hypothetical protein